MDHPISACVSYALEDAILAERFDLIADAFVEMYVLAQMGVSKKSYAAGVDEICVAILSGEVRP